MFIIVCKRSYYGLYTWLCTNLFLLYQWSICAQNFYACSRFNYCLAFTYVIPSTSNRKFPSFSSFITSRQYVTNLLPILTLMSILQIVGISVRLITFMVIISHVVFTNPICYYQSKVISALVSINTCSVSTFITFSSISTIFFYLNPSQIQFTW